jgi:DNA repair ATPase RecN
MRRRTLVFSLTTLLLSHGEAQDLHRGIRNFSDVRTGRKRVEDLSPDEQQEVMHIARQIGAIENRRGMAPKCQNALDRADSRASELRDRTRKLRECADTYEHKNSCEDQFRTLRNVHNDYESAVSAVKLECK